MDAHAQHEVDETAGGVDYRVRLALGVERDAHAEPELSRLRDHAREVVAHLVVHCHAVAACFSDRLEVLLG